MRSVISETKRLLGFYKDCERIELDKIKRLIFVCSGNICRSPLGEVIARSYGVTAESYGLDTRGGDPADPRAVAFALNYGIDLTRHVTRHIKEYKPLTGDLLIGMEPIHVQKLKAQVGRGAAITLAGFWLKQPIAYLHDPFNANQEYFVSCELQVMASVNALVARMEGAKIK